MKVLLKSDGKTVLFKDGALTGTINVNDDMWQTLDVETETPLIDGRESLWVVFQLQNDPLFITNELLLARDETDGHHRILIPDGVIAVPGTWTFQLFIRTYDNISGKWVKRVGANIDTCTFTVENGLPVSGDEKVTNGTIASLYNTAMEKIAIESENANDIFALKEDVAELKESGGGGSSENALTKNQNGEYIFGSNETIVSAMDETSGADVQISSNGFKSRTYGGAVFAYYKALGVEFSGFGSADRFFISFPTDKTKNDTFAMLSDVAPIKTQVELQSKVLAQSGLIQEYKATIEDTYTERTTADGANVLDGSTAILEKVVGNTVRVDNTLKNASFSGLESKTEDQTKASAIVFPLTDMPIGKTIDFVNKKIVEEYAKYTFTGQESVTVNGSYGEGYFRYTLKPTVGTMKKGTTQNGICDRYKTDTSDYNRPTGEGIRFGQNNTAIMLILSTEFTAAEVQSLIAGMTMYYPIETPIETPFTQEQAFVDNKYTAWKNGTEKVSGNTNADYGADNTLSQNYIIVAEVD